MEANRISLEDWIISKELGIINNANETQSDSRIYLTEKCITRLLYQFFSIEAMFRFCVNMIRSN